MQRGRTQMANATLLGVMWPGTAAELVGAQHELATVVPPAWRPSGPDRSSPGASFGFGADSEVVHVECPCCGEDAEEMRWLTARRSDYSRLVCDLCHGDGCSPANRSTSRSALAQTR